MVARASAPADVCRLKKKEYVINVQETAHTRRAGTVGGRIDGWTGGRAGGRADSGIVAVSSTDAGARNKVTRIRSRENGADSTPRMNARGVLNFSATSPICPSNAEIDIGDTSLSLTSRDCRNAVIEGAFLPLLLSERASNN